ncbi:MAG: triose-phosphate isomerase [Granulosicoccaceae bacterium]
MRTPLVIGNWKQNGSIASAKSLAEAVVSSCVDKSVHVGVCPAALHLAVVAPLLGDAIALGAQDVSEYAGGAYTGQITGEMLAEMGCRYALVGHSERRSLCGESSADVGAKAKAALTAGVVPVVCVGETLEDRQNERTEAVIAAQLQGLFTALAAGDLLKCVIAYEPVWAIGTGMSATAEQAGEVHSSIRAQLESFEVGAGAVVQILYGGSVKPGNAAEIFAQPDVDGGLIGGAALNAADFSAIVAAASGTGE